MGVHRLGPIGLFLPLLQGVLFLLIGLIILSKEYHWAGKLLRQLRQGFPKLDRGIEKAPSSAERPLGVAKTKGLGIKSLQAPLRSPGASIIEQVSDRLSLRGYSGCDGEECFLGTRCGYSLRSLRLEAFDRKVRQGIAKDAKEDPPKVWVETPAPPVLGKETPAGRGLPASCFLEQAKSETMPLTDKFGRAITDLRISITDRCNYKCVYCRTGNGGALYGELPFEDYLRMARILVSLGITKVRLTGGEPLLRTGVVDFVRDLAKLRSLQNDPLDIATTTNGHLLADLAQPLKDAGLNRITVSMDAVDPDRFARITRVPGGYDNVLAGIRAARRAGLWPLKVNCVLMRGFNEDQIIPFGMFAREEGVIVRFIEFMPLEEDRMWSPATVVTLDEILNRMAEYRPLVEIPRARSETARRYRFDDGVGEIGIIAPVSHPFCGHCSRIRVTSDGKIRTCLFSVWDHDLHELMRRGASDDELVHFVRDVVSKKEERHHIGEPDFVPASRTMVHIGG